MGIKRVVDTSFWTDGKVDEFSPEDKYFMLYLLTNPFTKQLGIYEISIKQAAFQMGYSIDAFRVLLDRFENKYKVLVFSPSTNEVAILNFLRHSVVKGGKPVEDCIKKEMTLVKNKSLLNVVFSHLHGRDDLNETVKKIVDDYIKENDIQNDNDNDNERTQGVSYNESLDDSLKKNKPAKQKPSKHKFGEFKNVLLTNEEYERLEKDYGSSYAVKAIDFLDAYIEEKGYKSKSHNLAIRRWVMDAVKSREEKKTAPKQQGYCKQTKADELEEFYDMAGSWAEE